MAQRSNCGRGSPTDGPKLPPSFRVRLTFDARGYLSRKPPKHLIDVLALVTGGAWAILIIGSATGKSLNIW